MASEPRKPPLQLAIRLRRVLGGQAGWGGVVVQVLFVAAVLWIGYEIIENARANLQAQRIASGFGFMSNTAGFAVSQALIPYAESDTYARVFVVGLLNTLLRPVLVLLTLPVTVLSLGLFLFVINALMFWAAAYLLDGLAVAGFSAALIGSLIYSLCGMVIDVVIERLFPQD